MQLPLWTTRNALGLSPRRAATSRLIFSLLAPAVCLALAAALPLHGEPPAAAPRYMGW